MKSKSMDCCMKEQCMTYEKYMGGGKGRSKGQKG